MKKIGVVLVLVFWFGLPVQLQAYDKSNEYQYWIETFLKRFEECHISMSTKDKEDLQSLLDIKPNIGGGEFFNVWFVKGYCKFAEDSGILIGPNEREKFVYLVNAKPNLQGSGKYYHFYFDYVLKKIGDFLPILDTSEKEYLTYLKKALPESLSSDYQVWLTEYERLKKEFGSIVSPDERQVLQFMADIKPNSNGNPDQSLNVKREKLLQIRYLIQNNQPYSAIAELDRILGLAATSE